LNHSLSEEPQYVSEDKKALYEDSLVTVFEFKLLFSIFCSRFCLNSNCSEALLKLFSKLLPQPNRVRQNLLQETLFDITKGYIKEIVCDKCQRVRQNNKYCLNEECEFFNKKSGVQEQEIFYFDTKKQISRILVREKKTLESYILVYHFHIIY
jgi:hypothetical protein